MIRLLIATRNAHKVEEIRSILGPGFEILTLNQFPGAPEVIEDAATFSGNAIKKAVELAVWLNTAPSTPAGAAAQADSFFVVADDSGLEVDALQGAPGVYSARFAALDSGQPGNSPTAENNAKLLRLLGDIPESRRAARFKCVLALTPARNGQEPQRLRAQTEVFEGTCEGRIIVELRGQGGFGYDPLFIPEGYDQTFAELGADIKNSLSHRARALAKLRRRLHP